MSRLSKIARKDYDRNKNAATNNALLSPQLIPKDRRRFARLICEIREQVQAAGGVAEKDIDRLIREYRERKRAG
jgi:hypothetical protein